MSDAATNGSIYPSFSSVASTAAPITFTAAPVSIAPPTISAEQLNARVKLETYLRVAPCADSLANALEGALGPMFGGLTSQQKNQLRGMVKQQVHNLSKTFCNGLVRDYAQRERSRDRGGSTAPPRLPNEEVKFDHETEAKRRRRQLAAARIETKLKARTLAKITRGTQPERREAAQQQLPSPFEPPTFRLHLQKPSVFGPPKNLHDSFIWRATDPEYKKAYRKANNYAGEPEYLSDSDRSLQLSHCPLQEHDRRSRSSAPSPSPAPPSQIARVEHVGTEPQNDAFSTSYLSPPSSDQLNDTTNNVPAETPLGELGTVSAPNVPIPTIEDLIQEDLRAAPELTSQPAAEYQDTQDTQDTQATQATQLSTNDISIFSQADASQTTITSPTASQEESIVYAVPDDSDSSDDSNNSDMPDTDDETVFGDDNDNRSSSNEQITYKAASARQPVSTVGPNLLAIKAPENHTYASLLASSSQSGPSMLTPTTTPSYASLLGSTTRPGISTLAPPTTYASLVVSSSQSATSNLSPFAPSPSLMKRRRSTDDNGDEDRASKRTSLGSGVDARARIIKGARRRNLGSELGY